MSRIRTRASWTCTPWQRRQFVAARFRAAISASRRWISASGSQRPRTITLFSQGTNQSVSGTDKGNAIINLHLATGRINRVGAGPFSITGQPNAMGGREVGGLANMLACHLGFSEAERADVAASTGADV